jgi:hypothetical protein
LSLSPASTRTVLLKADINYVTILGQKLWHATLTYPTYAICKRCDYSVPDGRPQTMTKIKNKGTKPRGNRSCIRCSGCGQLIGVTSYKDHAFFCGESKELRV